MAHSANGFRNRRMLQATADTAALGAVIDLPADEVAVATAVACLSDNMATGLCGHTLRPEHVTVASRDMEGHMIGTGGPAPDRVYVTDGRSVENEISLPVSLLRVFGLCTRNTTTEAIAQRFTPDCLTDGPVAHGIVDISPNNGSDGEICVHRRPGGDITLTSNDAPGLRLGGAPDAPCRTS